MITFKNWFAPTFSVFKFASELRRGLPLAPGRCQRRGRGGLVGLHEVSGQRVVAVAWPMAGTIRSIEAMIASIAAGKK